MVERRLLTSDFVTGVIPPTRGERWIADTKIPGFGLRLWSTNEVGQKAYALRATDSFGRNRRRTYDLSRDWGYRLDFQFGRISKSLQLGDYLENARRWARDEIDVLKGRPTISEEARSYERAASTRVKTMSLKRASERLLAGMKLNGLSEAYRNRLDKLFGLYVPEKLKSKCLDKLRGREIAKCLMAPNLSRGNARTLRAFISQIFERGANFYGPLGRIPKEISKITLRGSRPIKGEREKYLSKLTVTDYQRIFAALDAESDRWQQAICIRLYFEFGISLSRLRNAQWKQILDSDWYPMMPGERRYWFLYSVRLDNDAIGYLNRLRRCAATAGIQSGYWFPATAADGDRPITTVTLLWRATLKSLGYKHYPLREYARRFRPQNNVSYHQGLLVQYGNIFADVRNVTELSKRLQEASVSI